MADIDRSAVLKRLRDMKELADAAYWHILDLRILCTKVETGLATAEANTGEPRSGVLGEDENHEDYTPESEA